MAKVYDANLTEFQDDKRNANKGTARGKAMLDKSIEKLGAGRSILVDKHGRIIAGNKTRQAMVEAGIERAKVVETDGTELVVVKRVDLDLEQGGAARELAYADNRVGEVDLEWEPEAIIESIDEGLDLGYLWSEQELMLLGNAKVEAGDDDEVKSGVDAPAIVMPGDVWSLGRHRLVCGDATDPNAYAAACGGMSPFIMVTDPPYGVEYDPNWRGGGDQSPVANDDIADWTEAWRLFEGDVAYVWHASLFTGVVAQSIANAGFEIRSQIVWNKKQLAMSRGHYHWKHEPCWYAVRKGSTARWCGDRKQSTVWDIEAPMKQESGDDSKVDHPTQKPVEAMMRPMLNHGDVGDVVYDPFLGSGTTIVAAERAGRICVGIELDPKRCDTILARWRQITGVEPVKI